MIDHHLLHQKTLKLQNNQNHQHTTLSSNLELKTLIINLIMIQLFQLHQQQKPLKENNQINIR